MNRIKFIRGLIIVLSGASFFASALGQEPGTTKRGIDDFVKQAARRFESSKIDFVGKTELSGRAVEEKVSYSMNGNQPEILAVGYRDGNIDHEEVFYFKNGSLIYSTERETPADGAGAAWSGNFYFQNEKLLDFSTNGHGKSELDDWDPEAEVLRMSRKRMKQLREHLRRGRR